MDHNKEHFVEEQWHYKTMTKFGFKPATPTTFGMVRSYEYRTSNGYHISCHSGVYSDYWHDHSGGKLPEHEQPRNSLWGTLEAYLSSLKKAGHIE